MRNYWLILLLCLTACKAQVNETGVPVNSSPTGTLIFTQLESNTLRLAEYDLATQTIDSLFDVPDRAWLSYSQADANGNQMVLAFAPAPPEGEIQFGYTDLYLLPRETHAVPSSLEITSGEGETFFDPVWAPDGRFIYYAHVLPTDDNSNGFITRLERLDNALGTVEIITNDAIWPRLSTDGRHLTYVFVHPDTLDNELMVAEADGSNPVSLLPSGLFEAVDVPFFSPNGSMVYFSAAKPSAAAKLPWWDRLMGVKVAAAHNLPSDWWRIPATGGEPELVADIDDVGLHGAFSPDGQFIAYISSTGLYVMNPDGTNRQQLLETTALNGLSWIP